MLRSGLLDISPSLPRVYPLAELPVVTEVAAIVGSLEYVVMQP